ncbi:MAG: hypothetical protein E3J86_11700 [Candidatus Thorarchaeota archaeon]|nr:MAG: hypothetical protein E3J86_11700 [Candidatus Thorarchaeota archaeon]
MIEDVTIKIVVPASTTTGSTSTTTDSTSPTDTTTDPSPNPDNGMSGLVLGAAVAVIAVAGIGGVSFMARQRKGASDAKVLVICPYCGAKTEQGITRCEKCGGDL